MTNQIITEEMLASSVLKAVLNPLRDMHTTHKERCQKWGVESINVTFDEFAYINSAILGSLLYDYIGNNFGDCDEALKDLNIK